MSEATSGASVTDDSRVSLRSPGLRIDELRRRVFPDDASHALEKGQNPWLAFMVRDGASRLFTHDENQLRLN